MFLLGKLRLWAVALAAALGAVILAYFRGASEARQREADRRTNEYINTRENIDKALGFDDADDAREWLRNRGK